MVSIRLLALFIIWTGMLILPSCSSTSTTSSSRYAYAHDSTPGGYTDVNQIPDAVPKVEPRSKYGNPDTYVAEGHRYYVLKSASGYNKKGIASWYGKKFQGHLTSSHESYDPWAMTAASPELPLPTYVKVTNLNNGRHVIVKVNDRGPFAANRILDLSYAAAIKLGYANKGTALVQVTAIDPSKPQAVTAPATTATASPATVTNSQPQLFLQVGAFAEYQNAEHLRQSLHAITQYPIHIQTANQNHHFIYRVQIGPLNTVEQSDQLFHQLQQDGYPQAITVVR